MPGDDRADVGAAHHSSEPRLIAQLHARREREHARHGRVMHGEDRAQRRGVTSTAASQANCASLISP
jgi:hypothetical protein